MLIKYAFLDRDGTLIYEPPGTKQIDDIKLLRILPGVLDGLKKLINKGFILIMITNQDALGTPFFPLENFENPQQLMLLEFKKNGITFEKIFICPHTHNDKCACRKPKTGLVDNFLKTTQMDKENSFVCGDRESDRRFAQNLGLQFIEALTNGEFPIIS